MTKKYFTFSLVFALVAFVSHSAFGQWDDAGTTDTSTKDSAKSSGGGGGWGDDWGGGGGSKSSEKAIEYKEYSRFVPPFDSLRDLIYYEGVIELTDPISPNSDTLWLRVRNFLNKRYGKENVKKFIIEEKKPDKMILKVIIPMVVSKGQFAKGEQGQLEFKLVIRLKDGDRLKYQAMNFVHVVTPAGAIGKPVRTYHEFYMRIKKGYQATDGYLLAADKEIKGFGDGLKKAVQDPYNPEEEDDDF